MKTILFAIDRMNPDPQALEYTLGLCRRMLARLDVLHIIPSPAKRARHIKKIASSALQVRDAFENTMIKATFAEAGVADPEQALKIAAYDRFKRLLPEKTEAHIAYHCVIAKSPTDTIIEQYVSHHHNVVLAVFDSQSVKKKITKRVPGRTIMPKLTIPLVRVKNA